MLTAIKKQIFDLYDNFNGFLFSWNVKNDFWICSSGYWVELLERILTRLLLIFSNHSKSNFKTFSNHTWKSKYEYIEASACFTFEIFEFALQESSRSKVCKVLAEITKLLIRDVDLKPVFYCWELDVLRLIPLNHEFPVT